MSTHTKPHRCTTTGCSRVDGFATANDLERHNKSCHSSESSTKYHCNRPNCIKSKATARGDNFRAHMKRVHKVELASNELEPYQ
jgi:hypothetical protein